MVDKYIAKGIETKLDIGCCRWKEYVYVKLNLGHTSKGCWIPS